MFDKFISIIFIIILNITSVMNIPLYGYESKALLNDTDFSDGFSILSQETQNNSSVKIGDFIYNDNSESPSWMIAQWNSGPCLRKNRANSDKYTLTDGKTKFITYNPAENSVSMRLNAAEIYGGEPAGDTEWPHLLLEQSPIVDYNSLSDKDKAFYNCDADRMVVSLDIRLKDLVDTTNHDGINAVQYLAYFYLTGTDGNKFIWFGLDLFDNRGNNDTYWAPDSAGGLMIYTLSTKDTYGSTFRTLNCFGKPHVGDDWVHIEVDLAPHIAKAIEAANESNTFGKSVNKSDFYISGTNIGFEIHGNYDCTVEIKDFQLTSYNKTK